MKDTRSKDEVLKHYLYDYARDAYKYKHGWVITPEVLLKYKELGFIRK